MTTAVILLSVLFPAKGWFGPDQAWNVSVRPPAGTTVRLVLTDFSGSSLDAEPTQAREFDKDASADIKQVFPAMATAGTYLLYAVPKAKEGFVDFVGTPLVITVREDRRRGAPPGPMVVKFEPLRYAIVSTDAGDMTMAFYFDVAPNTISNFLSLAGDGFYDGLTFHRAEAGFLVQGGDPRGDGTGGPGYNIDAEFSDRKHEEGVVSMARNVDPNEAPNNPPRPEYANSAGSQFFIAVNHDNTAQLDGVYTVFGKVIGDEGLRTLAALAATPVADKKTARPVKPPVIKRVEIRPVTSRENPYRVLQAPVKAAAPVNSKKVETVGVN
ncbi:MAG: peptidylprolyl isomerase/peptidyl-prolyl cis-trans isomerase [Phycisphaerales bacterium]|nr:peptidylprolyl isomerase/peptidyl-prolyl cis-trans isomerase [Phycisphaerales bacterium]